MTGTRTRLSAAEVDNYGWRTQRFRTVDRETVGYVARRNGAWLLSVAGSLTDDLTPEQLYDAASSLAAAKRVCVQMCREIGYSGAVRWASSNEGRLWELEMTVVAEETDYLN